MSIIEVRHLCKTFEQNDARVEALRDISLQIEAGDIYGIIGMSGAGKSTLVRCMNFLEQPTEGKVMIEGKSLGDYSKKELQKKREEFDANYFQYIPYLDSFNEEKGIHIVNAGGIRYEPFGIYAGTKSSLDDLAEGDSIAVPNDTTNEARALLLLQDNGIITLKEGAGLKATVNDIAENPKNIQIVELEAAQVARVVAENAFVVLNGNYALEAGFSVGKDAIAHETSDSEAAKTYVNIIGVKEGNENSDSIKALVDVLKSDEIKNYINETYDGAVIPFED